MAERVPDDVEPILTAGALRVVVASVPRELPADPEAFGEVADAIDALPPDASAETVRDNWMRLCSQLRTIPIDDLPTVLRSLPADDGVDAEAARHWFTWGVYDQRIFAEIDDPADWTPQPRALSGG